MIRNIKQIYFIFTIRVSDICCVHFTMFNVQTEEEKVSLERKTREAEQLTARLVDESERRAAEANKLKEELLRARVAEKQAKEKLLEFLSRNAYVNTVRYSFYILILIIFFYYFVNYILEFLV